MFELIDGSTTNEAFISIFSYIYCKSQIFFIWKIFYYVKKLFEHEKLWTHNYRMKSSITSTDCHGYKTCEMMWNFSNVFRHARWIDSHFTFSCIRWLHSNNFRLVARTFVHRFEILTIEYWFSFGPTRTFCNIFFLQKPILPLLGGIRNGKNKLNNWWILPRILSWFQLFRCTLAKVLEYFQKSLRLLHTNVGRAEDNMNAFSWKRNTFPTNFITILMTPNFDVRTFEICRECTLDKIIGACHWFRS